MREERRGVNVGVYLPLDLVKRFRLVADSLPRRDSPSLSRICREAIERWLDEVTSWPGREETPAEVSPAEVPSDVSVEGQGAG